MKSAAELPRESTRRDFIKIRRAITRSVKDEVRERRGPLSRELRSYYRTYRSAFRKPWSALSSRKDMLDEVMQSDVVLMGDFHTLRFSQKEFLNLLLQARARGEPVAVGLEIFRVEHRRAFARYLKERPPRHSRQEIDFLHDIRYESSWGFPWHAYRDIEIGRAHV